MIINSHTQELSRTSQYKYKLVKMKLLVLVISALIGATWGLPWIPEPRDTQSWIDQHAGFVNNTLNNPGSIRVLFYGDSITAGWNGNGRETFNQYYAPLGTANYGISGDRTEHVLYRMKDGEVTSAMSPAVCVIKIGTNNLGSSDDNAIALGIIYDVVELRERLPNTKILLLGVLPRNNEDMTKRTSNINEVIRHLDNGNTIRFFDMKDHFYRGGNDFVTELYTSDLLHLSAAGYKKWAEVMDPLFREMLNSTLIA